MSNKGKRVGNGNTLAELGDFHRERSRVAGIWANLDRRLDTLLQVHGVQIHRITLRRTRQGWVITLQAIDHTHGTNVYRLMQCNLLLGVADQVSTAISDNEWRVSKEWDYAQFKRWQDGSSDR